MQYSWHELARRADASLAADKRNSSEALRVAFVYSRANLAPEREHQTVIVEPAPAGAWHRLRTQLRTAVDWLPAERVMPCGWRLPIEDRVPVLLWGSGRSAQADTFAERIDERTVVFHADIVSSTLYMLSRWEETEPGARDQHGRFAAVQSTAHKQGFLHRPIVDEYGLILRAWLRTLFPAWSPQLQQFRIKLTHDIDRIRKVSRLAAGLRTLGGDLVKRRSLTDAGDTLRSMARLSPDSFHKAIYTLSDISEHHGLQSAFYFMAAQRSRFDDGYDAEDRTIRRTISELKHRGHEVGFHPGYYTADCEERFMEQRHRMARVLGVDRFGGRQHFLRFFVPETWRLWEQAGLSYDSTLGYADCEGFRCGTCHPFQPFDLQQNRTLNITELPLIAMDATLLIYRKLSPEAAGATMLSLANRCRAVQGVFTLLWHNSSLAGDFRNHHHAYVNFLGRLSRV